jgi:hypothetical protein
MIDLCKPCSPFCNCRSPHWHSSTFEQKICSHLLFVMAIYYFAVKVYFGKMLQTFLKKNFIPHPLAMTWGSYNNRSYIQKFQICEIAQKLHYLSTNHKYVTICIWPLTKHIFSFSLFWKQARIIVYPINAFNI